MKVWFYSDEVDTYLLDEWNGASAGMELELSDEEYADLRRVMGEHKAWQTKIAEMYVAAYKRKYGNL